MADRYVCTGCKKTVSCTKNRRYRSHSDGAGEPCEMSSVEIPGHLNPVSADADPSVPVEGVDFATCPQCARKVKLTRLGYFEPHDETLRGGDRCRVSGVRLKHARKTETVPLPGDEPKEPEAAIPAVKDSESSGKVPSATAMSSDSQIDWSKVGDLKHLPDEAAEEEAEREYLMAQAAALEAAPTPTAPAPDIPESSTTATEIAGGAPAADPSSPALTSTREVLQPAPVDPVTSSDAEEEPVGVVQFHLAPLLGDGTILQPFSHILQPTPYEKVRAEPMGDLAKELATKIQETFYAYSNRKTSDNRSAQTTLGPSEIGTPCDRRLAMALLGVPPVNPGGDGWAAFVGTCTHVGMAEIYTFADAGTGRYAVELPVFLGVPTVPRGTTDLLDRRDGTVVDWKIMGSYSLKKFKEQGPSATYRTQAHVYGLGAEKGGEKVRNVAVVGLPRAGRSLDEMHVWTEKYDRKFAEAALARVETIADNITGLRQYETQDVMQIARMFEVADDCRYCPFHLKNDKEMKRGCPGK